MKENYKTFIQKSIESIGGKDVSEQIIEDQANICFSIILNKSLFFAKIINMTH